MSELQRLMNLVPYLHAHQGIRVDEVAAEFGVSRQRIIDDLRILQFVGLPGGYHDDLFEVDLHGAREYGDIFVHNVDPLARPMRLTRDQASSLIVALQLVMEVGGDEAGARSALDKLQRLSLDAQAKVDIAVDSGGAEVRAKLARAVAERNSVELTYRAGGRGAPRTAVVEPGRLRTDGGYAYVDAWSRARDGWRTYRLDRIDAVQILDESIPDRAVPASLDTWFAEADREFTVVVTEAGRWCADYHPTTEVVAVDEGWRITFPLVSVDWGARLLLRLGDAVLHVSDDAVTAAAQSLAHAALEHYAGQS